MNSHQRRSARRLAERDPCADAGYQRFLVSMAKQCTCCPSCNIKPCDGCAAGGPCDGLCRCGEDYCPRCGSSDSCTCEEDDSCQECGELWQHCECDHPC